MDDANPVACSLAAGDLERRLVAIAKLGADSLTGRTVEGGRYLLRFRDDATTRGRLRAIVAAEAECCSFLELALGEEAGELVLSISAPEDAEPVADELARAFAGREEPLRRSPS